MNKRLKGLYDRKAVLVADMQAMLNKASAENRKLSEQEDKDYQLSETELGAPAEGDKAASGIFADIAREERLAKLELVQPKVTDRNELTQDQIATLNGLEPVKKLPFPITGSTKYFKGDTQSEANKLAYNAGMWYLATIHGRTDAINYTRDQGFGPDSLAAQSAATPNIGGVLVPEEMSGALIDLRETYGVFRQNVSVMPMGSETLLIPRRTGGLTGYFVADTTATTESQANWDNIGLTAKELSALVRYPNGLADDAVIALADYLTNEISYAFALKEDQCGFTGDGTSTYGGIFGVAAKINDGNHAGGIQGAASSTSFESMALADFNATAGKLPQYALPNAKWYISSAGWQASMARLMYAAGGNTWVTVGEKVTQMFLGYPVVISQVLNATLGADASKIKCLFGDLNKAVAMAERRGISIASSTERYFEYRQIGLIGSERFDINVHDVGDGSNAGPIVALKSHS